MLPIVFAWRYFKAKKSTNAINIIAWISVAAIAFGAAALIVVLSVFNGFEGLVKRLYSDFYADVRIIPATGKTITATTQQLKNIQALTGIEGISPIVEEKAVLVNGDYQSIITLKGVTADYEKYSNIKKHILRGKFELGTATHPTIVAGVGIENAVGLDVERSLVPATIYIPNKKAANFSNIDALNSFSVQPVGAFLIQQDFDDKYVFTNLAFIQFMLDLKANEFSSVELKLAPNTNIASIKNALNAILNASKNNKVTIQTRYEQNESLFTVMMIEKWVIYGILTIILIVASFNIIGALTMLVLEKQKDIAILKALGGSNGFVQQIFISVGLLIAVIGGGTGMVFALFICLIQIHFKLIKLGAGTFLIDYYPVILNPMDFILVCITILGITVLAAWIPAKKAGYQLESLK